MKNNLNFYSYIFLSYIPISSSLMTSMEIDCLSQAFCFCFLILKSIQAFGRAIPILPKTILRLGGFSYSSQRRIYITSGEHTPTSSSQSGFLKETDMGKKKKAFPFISETIPKKKLKLEVTEEKKLNENNRKRPNYFVAVQISNPDIHEAIQRIQDHIIARNKQLIVCMNSIATLHITLMVMSITDADTHDRALKALRNIHEEFKDEMCRNPLILEFCGLGHFKNRVLYAKIKENESFERLCGLAERVRKNFANLEILSTDQREFNPHLTIAKIDFSKKKQKILKKIEPSLYESFINEYVGCETIVGIQLLNMTIPKNEAGYYIGENLVFDSNITHGCNEINLADINKNKKDIRTKIANLVREVLK